MWYNQNDLLKQKVILERHWATEGIFKIIFDEKISTKGRFSRSEAERIWEKEDAYRFQTADLIEMMKEFKICLPTKSDKNQYLIPALLSEMEPKNINWQDKKRMIVEYQYKPILPRGLVNHLSAEMYQYIESDDHVWNSGVWLHIKNAQAKVKENRFERKITIELAGVEYKELFGAIRTEMKNIHKDYGGLTFNLMIPCTCKVCINMKLDLQQYYRYDELIERQKCGKKTKECSISFEDVLVKKLLGNILSAPKTTLLKIFICYGNKDSEYRQKIEKQLKPFLRGKQIQSIWSDQKILPGQNWSDEIENNLETADLILLLISDDFFASDHICNNELPIVKERHSNKDCNIMPILIRPTSHWDKKNWLYSIQAIPSKNGELTPISLWKNEDAAWKVVTDEIRRFLYI